MSEKVEISIQDNADLDQPEEQSPIEDCAEQNPPDNENVTVCEEDEATQLESAERQVQEHYDRLLRLSAEFDNYKKRSLRETRELVKYANENLIKELLTIVDNLERAIASAGEDGDVDGPLMQGIHLTLSAVLKILERYNVQPVKALGEPFDPAFHQAMMQEATTDQPANTVIREMQTGYVMHDRLLRPAMVVVAKAVDAPPSDKEDV
jgi:molecular chaperone GrpE